MADRGAWHAVVHEVTESGTWLSDWTTNNNNKHELSISPAGITQLCSINEVKQQQITRGGPGSKEVAKVTDQEPQIQNDLCSPAPRSSQLRTRGVLKKVFFFFFNFACPASALQPVGFLELWRPGFSCYGAQALECTGSVTVVGRLSYSVACRILVPWPGIEPAFPAL